MTAVELTMLLETVLPDRSPRNVAALCMMLVNSVPDLEELRDRKRLIEAIKTCALRIRQGEEQRQATIRELQRCGPDVSKNQLRRALKTTNGILELWFP